MRVVSGFGRLVVAVVRASPVISIAIVLLVHMFLRAVGGLSYCCCCCCCCVVLFLARSLFVLLSYVEWSYFGLSGSGNLASHHTSTVIVEGAVRLCLKLVNSSLVDRHSRA
jgi:hypothetical protein